MALEASSDDGALVSSCFLKWVENSEDLSMFWLLVDHNNPDPEWDQAPEFVWL